MSRYTERLWRELMREHGAELSRISRPARHGRVARPRLLAGTTAGLAGMGTTVALLLGAASSTPAFAVTQNHDGTVRVVIRQIGALHGVNARLAQLGLRARFVEVAPGCGAGRPAAMALANARTQVRLDSVRVEKGFVTARFDPKKIPAGQTLVVTAWRQGHLIKAAPGHIVIGAAPNCMRAFTALPGATVHGRGGRGDVVRCIVTAVLRPADSAPTTTTPRGTPAPTTASVPGQTTANAPGQTTAGVPGQTTAGVPATTTGAGAPPTSTTATGAPPAEAKPPACPPASTAKVQKALAHARSAATNKH